MRWFFPPLPAYVVVAAITCWMCAMMMPLIHSQFCKICKDRLVGLQELLGYQKTALLKRFHTSIKLLTKNTSSLRNHFRLKCSDTDQKPENLGYRFNPLDMGRFLRFASSDSCIPLFSSLKLKRKEAILMLGRNSSKLFAI